MKITAAATIALTLAGNVPVGADDAVPPGDSSPQVGLFVGYGASAGGLGGGAELYMAGSRISLFGAVGFIRSTHGGRAASGEAAAAGVRLFTGGRRHRGFAEGSLGPAGRDIAAEGSGLKGEHITYGPGLSLGYHVVASGGVTFMVSAGVAYGMTGPERLHHGFVVSTAALGYTWRRKLER